MKKIALIGFGKHATKNIIPAISRLKDIDVESVYVRKVDNYLAKADEHGVSVKRIDESINDEVQWVYISTPISTHYELIRKYLELGKNVICEKPLTDDLKKTRVLFELAKQEGVKLYEVNMYHYHRQFEHLKNTISENLGTLKKVNARFTIPHLPKDDIRYQNKMGGGSLLDVGFYPISIITSLFGSPTNIHSTQFSEVGYKVDLFGSAIFEFGSFYCIAEWGIGLPYTNEVIVTTEKQIIKYDRIFSKTETIQTFVKIKEGLDTYTVDIGNDDHFVNMLRVQLFNMLPNNYTVNIKQSIDVISAIEKINKLENECN